jgi:anthranilate synthase component 2
LQEGLPDCLRVLATTKDGEIMAMRHRDHPVVGLQFHPESIYTEHGKRMVENFVNGVI